MLYTSSGTRGAPCARDVLDAWLTAPVDHAQRATAALHCLSYLLNPADPAARPAQERLLGLTGKGLKQVRAAFAHATQAPGATDQGQQARATAAVTFADNLARLLYTESGAADANRPDPAPKQRGDLQRFALLIMPSWRGSARSTSRASPSTSLSRLDWRPDRSSRR